MNSDWSLDEAAITIDIFNFSSRQINDANLGIINAVVKISRLLSKGGYLDGAICDSKYRKDRIQVSIDKVANIGHLTVFLFPPR